MKQCYYVSTIFPIKASKRNNHSSKGINSRFDQESIFTVSILLPMQEILFFLSKAGKAAKLEKFEIPAKIKLLPDPWTPESGLVTAALKLKRELLKTKFKDELHKLYD